MNEIERQRRQAEELKKKYPPGTRVLLESMGDDPRPIESGTRGKVISVDDIGTVHCAFDNGRSLGLVVGEDSFRKLTETELAEERKEKRIVPFGDGCEIRLSDEPIDCIRLEYFDELEYDCWELVKNYCAKFGVEILPLDDEDEPISFDIAKGIQDKIIESLQDAGVKIQTEEQTENVSAKKNTSPVQEM